MIFSTQGSASTRSMATDTDAADEFDFGQSSFTSGTQADSSQAQDMALLWDDLPLSPELGLPIVPAQYGNETTLLQDHNVEDFLDDEDEWTQGGAGGWVWRASEPLMHFDFDKDERRLSANSDLDQFPSDSSQDLLLTPPRSRSRSRPSLSSPNTCNSEYRQIGAETVGRDRDSNCEAKSQDCDVVPGTPNTPNYTHHLDSSSNLTSTQEQPSNPIARHQRSHSETGYLDCYYYSDTDSNSDILHNFEDDVPEILSGSSFAPVADEIRSGDYQFVLHGKHRFH
jgi:hypothetical protein